VCTRAAMSSAAISSPMIVGADQQTVERARDPKIVPSEILASFLDAFFVGVGGDHIPSSLATLLLLRRRRQPKNGASRRLVPG
jgi:hypothetical protein